MVSANACIFGCEGLSLSADEHAFFRDANPWGFIVFARNVDTPDQLRALTGALRESVGRNAPILVDQEGGRVQRLSTPHWKLRQPAAAFGALARRDLEAGREAVRLNAQLIAHELHEVGLNVDCLPCIDVPVDGADPIIGDRAYGTRPTLIAELGRMCLEGLEAGGVAGVIKHIPGHGRAEADSHLELPTVNAPAEDLIELDFAPFIALGEASMAMTAHVVYSAYDAGAPATTSPVMVQEVIRGLIGFDGLLMTDDLSMNALAGPMTERVGRAIAAGCDVGLHCNGDMTEMKAVAAAAPRLEGRAAERAAAALPGEPDAFDVEAGEARLLELLAPVGGGAIA